MRIVVCDDEWEWIEILEKYLTEFRKTHKNITWDAFASSEELLSYTKENSYIFDVLITDIEMSGIACLQSEPLKYRTAVMLTLYTGMRRGELCGLNWSDVDFKSGTITVNKAILYSADAGIFEDSTKTKSSNRIISVPDSMIKLLKTYHAEQLKQRLALGDQWIDSGKIFTSENGGVINPESLSGWFKNFVRRYNLPDIHFHNLRHTAATLLIANGVDLATVSKRLGHADKTTTLNIYTHAIKSADRAAADKLEDILSHSKIS